MKKIIALVTIAIIVMACNKKGTSIQLDKTKERYELTATYPNSKTEKLEGYLKAVLQNGDSVLHTEDIHVGKEIRLANGAVFYLRHNPGKLEMEMLVVKNNNKGYQYFDKVANGVKELLN